MNWRDNPWFSGVLRTEMEHMKTNDPAAYDHVWEGLCVANVEGAIYANELRQVDLDQRITRVPYDATRPVHTFWDLGWGDSTCIWFVQAFPFEYRLIDYVEGDSLPLKHYQREVQNRPYVYGNHYLPHDARAHQLSTGKSVEELMRGAGFKVVVLPKLSIIDGINAARTIFPQCWFDGEKCADGIQALRHYRWAPEGTLGQVRREPLHDWASNAADGFREFAVGIKQPINKPIKTDSMPIRTSAWS
jgi:phage terminase large subunit